MESKIIKFVFLKSKTSIDMVRAALAILLLILELNCFGQIQFLPVGGTLAPTYTAGSESQALEHADFNNDGNIDIATANTLGNNISILNGNGNGTFASPQSVGSVDTPLDLVASDFNNDGKADIAVPSYTGGMVYLYLGQGNGSFTLGGKFACGSEPRNITSGDFNKDGKSDLAIINESSSTITILLGNGNGTLQTAVNYSTSSTPNDILTTDLNGDSNPDLVTVGISSNTIVVHFGNGTGNFATTISISGVGVPIAIETADLNQDGFSDLITTDNSSYYLIINNGNGTFQNPVQANPLIKYAFNIQKIKSEDIDNDGYMDLVFLNSTHSNIAVLLGNGDATFQTEKFFGIGSHYPLDIDLADFNADGKTDLSAVVDIPMPGAGSVSILIGTGNGNFSSVKNFPIMAYDVNSGNSILQKDINGDTFPDLIATNGYGIYTFKGNGDGSFEFFNFYLTYTYPTNRLISGFTMEDFNKDGYWDIVVTYSTYSANNTISLFLGTNTGVFQNSIDINVSTNGKSIVSGDFNNDGKKDIVVCNTSSCILLGNGNGTFQSPLNINTGGYGSIFIASADINNDSKEDLLVTNSRGSGTTDQLVALIGQGNGTFADPVYYSLGSSCNPVFIATADFNKDGIKDVAVAQAANNSISVLISKGDGTFLPRASYYGGAAPASIAIADYNGDGNNDLVIACYNSEKVAVLAGKVDGTFNTPLQTRLVANPVSVIAGDFDGDNKIDIACIGNSIAVLINTSATTVTPNINVKELCSGSSISIPYIARGKFTGSNTFTAQLSDVSGGFSSPTNISTSVTSSVSGTLNATIPSGTPPGTHYRIRVTCSDPSVFFIDNGTDLSVINTVPSQPSSFVINATSCLGNKTYTTTLVSGNTYIWSLSGGGILTSNLNSALVNWTTIGGPFTLTCTPVNVCGIGTAKSETVTVTYVPAQPSTITFPAHHCQNTTQSYSVVNDVNASSYTWILSSGWTGTSNVDSIAVTSTTVSGTIQVYANNACGASAARTASLNAPLSVSKPVISKSGNTLSTTGSNVSFLWKIDGVDAGNTTSTFNNVVTSGQYTVEVTDLITGCKSVSDPFSFVYTGIEENILSENKIYPNPSSGKVYIEIENIFQLEITVKNCLGVEVYKTRSTNNSTEIIDLTGFPKGVYNLFLKSDKDYINKKIILE